MFNHVSSFAKKHGLDKIINTLSSTAYCGLPHNWANTSVTLGQQMWHIITHQSFCTELHCVSLCLTSEEGKLGEKFTYNYNVTFVTLDYYYTVETEIKAVLFGNCPYWELLVWNRTPVDYFLLHGTCSVIS